MKKLEVIATYKNRENTLDIELADGTILADIPYFERLKGNPISYDEALELYDFEELSQYIWEDEIYLTHLYNYLEKNGLLESYNL